MLIPFNYSLGPVENHESISSRSWKVMLKLSAKAGCVICPFKVFTPFARLESVVTAFAIRLMQLIAHMGGWHLTVKYWLCDLLFPACWSQHSE